MNVVESDLFIECDPGHRKLPNVIENASKIGSKLSDSAIDCDRVLSKYLMKFEGVFLGGTFDSLSITFDATSYNFRTIRLVLNFVGGELFHRR